MELARAACRVAVLTVAVLTAPAAPSLARSPAQTCVHVSPGQGDSVPASAPSLLTVKVRSGPATPGSVIERISLRVWGPSGPLALVESPDPFSVPDSSPGALVRSSDPVAPGQYRLEYVELCAGGTRAASFTVTDPAPLPTSIGSLTLDDQRLARACPPSRHALEIATVRLDLSPEMRPFLPVMLLHGSFDGVPVGALHPGSPFSDVYGDLDRGEANFFFAAGCRDAADARYFTPAKHEIVFQAQIAGATASPAPARLTLDFTCPGLDRPLTAEEQATCASAQGQEPRLDAGTLADAASEPSDGDAPLDVEGAAASDAGSARSSTPRSSRGGGCSIVGPVAPPPLVAVVLSLTLLGVGRLRTRRAVRCRRVVSVAARALPILLFAAQAAAESGANVCSMEAVVPLSNPIPGNAVGVLLRPPPFVPSRSIEGPGVEPAPDGGSADPVQDGGAPRHTNDDGSCQVAASGPAVGWWVAAVALIALRFRGRKRSRSGPQV